MKSNAQLHAEVKELNATIEGLRAKSGNGAADKLDLNGIDFTEFLAIDWKQLVTKMIIGGVYGYAVGTAAGYVINYFTLLTSIVWLQYVISFVGILLMIYAVWTTTNFVVNHVYDGGAKAIDIVKHGADNVHTWFTNNVTNRQPKTA